MSAALPSVAEARRIVGLAVPLSMVQLAQVAMSTTDMVMLGWFGEEALAAGALGFLAFNLLRTMGFGLVVGTSNLVATDAGAEVRGAHFVAALLVATASAAIAVAVMTLGSGALAMLGQDAGVVEVAARYLAYAAPGMLPLFWFYAYRGVAVGRRKARGLLAITIGAAALNAALDYGLLYGAWGLPRLGPPGVAAASSLVYLAQFVAIALATHASVAFDTFRPAAAEFAASLWRLLKIGVPTAASYGSEAGFTYAVTLMVGTFGAAALAAHAVVAQICYVVFMLSVGLSHATSVGVSEAAGRRDAGRALRAGRTGFAIGATIMAAFSLAYLAAPAAILAPFSVGPATSPEVFAVAATLLPVAAAFQIFDCLQNVAIGALRGVDRAGTGFWVTIGSYWLVGAPAAWAIGAGFGAGPAGVWVGLAIGLVAAALGMIAVFEAGARRLGAPQAAAP